MKTTVKLALSILVIGAFSLQALDAAASPSTSKKSAKKVQRKSHQQVSEKSEEKLDRAAVIFNKCTAIEKLSKRKSATKCLDKFLDRMDFEVGNVETRIMRCGELRRLENIDKGDNGESVRLKIIGEIQKLRDLQAARIDKGALEVSRAGGQVGPRKMKEIELRAAEIHSKSAEKLAALVCSKPAFAKLMTRR